ncbi:molybdopterin molybdotransferase MoeA [Hydrogenophaga sp. BPS33]|uniref:molybdopterin molybdotransferase MoeA n=1 Tax=Hydrogenophaga sp. BPS33 TaxID=2651974 RepID=UPI001F259B6C|nr:gephyrin-like molybdotransferase Glp [Hydrogenophaga sp. BPS33]
MDPVGAAAAQDLAISTAAERLAHLVQPVAEAEDVALRHAQGRVLARDIVSPIDVPPHDNSAMDGYAFDGLQLAAGQALRLRVIGTVLAGRVWSGEIGVGECVKIMTGAPMPQGLDTVVPFELAALQGDTHIVVAPGAVRRGDNRRRRGEDLKAGHSALRQGQALGPAALGLIASLGLPSAPVWRRVRVAYFSTGDEILNPGDPPREGAVYDSNGFSLMGLLTRLGVDVIDLGVVRDTPAQLEAALRAAAQQADAIVTSGGVSMGDADHTKATMAQLGEVAFWRIAMRPGRPMAVGHIRRAGHGAPALLFGLPGNPVAAMVTFLVFVRPALQRLMGAVVTDPVCLRATSSERLRKKPGRTEYQRGIVTRAADGALSARTTGPQGSGVLRSMVEANGLIVLPHEQGDVAVGDTVEVMMFDGAI